MTQTRFSEEDIKKVAKGTGTTLVGSSIGRGVFFLSQILIARFLGVEAFGLYALGFATVKICEIFGRFGLNMGGMRYVSIYKDEDQPRLKGTIIAASGISLLIGSFVSILLYLLSDIIAQKAYNKPELADALQFFAFSIPFLSGMTVVSSLLQGFHTTKYTIYTREIIQPIANIIFVAAFYYAKLGLRGMIVAFVLSHVIACIAGIIFLCKVFPKLVKKDMQPIYDLKNLISYSAPLLFVGILQYFITWTDILMLGFLSTTKEVGIYRAASQVPFIMTIFLMATNSIYAPLVADLYKKGEKERLASIFKTSTRWICYATIPMFIFLTFTSKEIILLFGREYVEMGSFVLILVSFGQLVNCITGSVGYNLTMTGRQKVELVNTLCTVFFKIIINLWLIKKYGAIGAAISTGVTVSIINLARFFEVYYLYRMIPFSNEMLKIMLPSLVSLLILWFFHADFIPSVKISLVASIITIIFGISFYIMKISDEDKFVISTFKRKINKVFQ